MTAVYRTPYCDGEENRERVTPNMGGRVEVYHLWHKPKLTLAGRNSAPAIPLVSLALVAGLFGLDRFHTLGPVELP